MSRIVDKSKLGFCKGKAEIVAFGRASLGRIPKISKFPHAISFDTFKEYLRRIDQIVTLEVPQTETVKKPTFATPRVHTLLSGPMDPCTGESERQQSREPHYRDFCTRVTRPEGSATW
ncbi:hypothetical protein N7535_000648 [Penicillium sp. DV-2018c]|nr:hypothetical protein N7461_006100 [Penicillium sp. DV-2018c]KAJ5582028.1 hypothetical protein N7535_000648 [Penicillium sp. DV-2018c]